MKIDLFKSLTIIIFTLATVLFTSCEGMMIADGAVYDELSNEPIDSVKCLVLETGEITYTDNNGKYYLEGPFGSCSGDCKDMTVEFSHIEYITQTIINPSTRTIRLKK
jgi:hypothetical protein